VRQWRVCCVRVVLCIVCVCASVACVLCASGVVYSVCVAEQLAAVPRLANIGPLFKSSHSPVELTESETEYIVRCVKHTFPHHIVFQVCTVLLAAAAPVLLVLVIGVSVTGLVTKLPAN